MTTPQLLAFAVLILTLALFIWGRWRHDVVALAALLACVALGLVEQSAAFAGFAHPALITVAAVLVISRGLQNAGLVDAVVQLTAPLRQRKSLQIGAQSLVVALLSGFMNNVGALALMMPVAIRNAYRTGYSPSLSLMPLAFASLLGGMVTLIGTPPNIIIALFREKQLGAPFGMFDFSFVGLPIALAGLVFMFLVGWRFLPRDTTETSREDVFSIADYVTETVVPEAAKAVGMTVLEIEKLADDEVTVLAVIRGKTRRLRPSASLQLESGDIVMLRGDTDSIKLLLDGAGLKLEANHKLAREDLGSSEVTLTEVVITEPSRLLGRNTKSAGLRSKYGVNLLALARQGERLGKRLGDISFRAGDVLLIQGSTDGTAEMMADFKLLPLAKRRLDIGHQRQLLGAAVLLAAAVFAILMGWATAPIAFVSVALVYVIADIVPLKSVYDSIDWPVIVLLAALLPVGGVLESTGAATLTAEAILTLTKGLGPVWVLVVLMVATMCMSDIMNNNATAILMAPIALTIAQRLGANPDPFLMAVAIGASCAFLTPVGHQANLLVMEPGGYRFSDYWKVGLPLELLIIAIGVPLLMLCWPP